MLTRRALLLTLVLTVAASWVVAAPPPRGDRGASWTLLEEHWYVIEVEGERAGWAAEAVFTDGARYKSQSRSSVSVKRGDTPITVTNASTFIETRSGAPVTMTLVQEMGQQPMSTEWRFEADRVVETSRQGGGEIVNEHPGAVEALPPMAARRAWIAAAAEGQREIILSRLDPQTGIAPVELRCSYVGEETIELEGRSVPVTVWTTTTDLLALDATEKYTAEGVLVHQVMRMPGMGVWLTRLTSRDDAERVVAAPEIMVRTFVRPDRQISRPMSATRIELRLTADQGSLPELPSAGAQTVRAGATPAEAMLVIDLSKPQPASEAERQDKAYLAASGMVPTDDPMLRALSEKAIRGASKGALERAEALRNFVHRHMTQKGLDTAFATASETAKTRSGDCSEHAVLLCALLRCQGIPARVAIGLVYVDEFAGVRQIFGWHMWTQALVDGAWLDLDATLPRRYHAGHVLTATSGLSDPSLAAELAPTLLLMGNLRIDVVGVEHE